MRAVESLNIINVEREYESSGQKKITTVKTGLVVSRIILLDVSNFLLLHIFIVLNHCGCRITFLYHQETRTGIANQSYTCHESTIFGSTPANKFAARKTFFRNVEECEKKAFEKIY